jgi:hypothetical protein
MRAIEIMTISLFSRYIVGSLASNVYVWLN